MGLSGSKKSETYQAKSRSRLLRQKVVFYASTISIIAPIFTTIVPHFAFASQPFGVLFGSIICILGSALNYTLFVRKGQVSTAATIQAVVTFVTYSISVFFSGGINSQFLIFAPFMPVFAGFLTGMKGTIATTAYLSLFYILITLFQTSLPSAPQMFNSSDFGALISVIVALLSVGALTCIYELVTEQSEIQLKSANAELQNAKEKLIESEDLLKSVISNVPVMILVKNYLNKGRYSLINKAAENFLGIETMKHFNDRIPDYLPSEFDSLDLPSDKVAFEGRQTIYIDQEQIMFQDGLKTFRTWKVPTYDIAGNPQLMIRLSMDITEELKLKQELELERSKSLKNAKLASLGEMSAGIAHEINNPLTIVSGTVRTLPKYVNNPDQLAKRIENIQAASERIAKIVGSLRKFSRTSDKSEYKFHSLCNILKEALVLTEAKARRHSTIISVDYKSPCEVFCDEIEIEQVLVNLIVNAIDAVTPKDERWVSVSIYGNNFQVIVQVKDSGSGIPPAVQEKMFQPFFTTKAVGEGTGLGLSIVKGILDEHKASIEVLNSEKNTCFEIKFPKQGLHPKQTQRPVSD